MKIISHKSANRILSTVRKLDFMNLSKYKIRFGNGLKDYYLVMKLELQKSSEIFLKWK